MKVVIYSDGGSRGNPGPAAAGMVLRNAQNQLLVAQGFFLGTTTNNVAEYTGIIRALKAAQRLQATTIELNSDSELLVKQLNGLYAVRSPNLKPLYQQACCLLDHFTQWQVRHVFRDQNKDADRLVNQALDARSDIIEQYAPSASTPKSLRLGVLISGGGRTLLNLLAARDRGELSIEVPLVVSSRSTVAGVERCKKAGLAVKIVRKKDFPNISSFSDHLEKLLTEAQVDLVIQAGWLCLWKIPACFANRVVNIHPALLPSFGGQGMWGHHVHEAVLATGCKVSGCTVHFCTDEYDSGPIIVQRCCPVEEDDNPDTLAARVFEQECLALPEAVRLFAEGRIQVENNSVRISGQQSVVCDR
ncbi:phosphoribosylglycinamide formyltransferase [Planctomycetota bacterium]